MEEEMCFNCKLRPRLPTGILCQRCKDEEPPSTTGITRGGGGGGARRVPRDRMNFRIEPSERDDDDEGFGGAL